MNLEFLMLIMQYIFAVVVAYFSLKVIGKLLPIKSGKFYKVLMTALLALYMVSSMWIGDENPVLMVPIFYIVIFISFGGSRVSKFVISTILYTMIIPSNMMVSSFFFLAFGYEIEVLIKTIIFGIIMFIVNKIIGDNEVKLSDKLWWLMGGLTLGPFIIMMTFTKFGMGDVLHLLEKLSESEIMTTVYSELVNSIIYRMAYMSLPFAQFSSIVVLIVMVLLSKHEEEREQFMFSELRENYYDGIVNEQKAVRTLKHDLKHHLNTVQNLLEQEKYDEVTDFVGKLNTSSTFGESRQISNNEIVNVIMDSKMKSIYEKGIRLDYKISAPEKILISDVDLSSMLGNALDNAIEAAEKTSSKYIDMKLRVDMGLFMLQIKNPIEWELTPSGETFLTTKRNAKEHGYGLTSIRDVVNLYNGTMDMVVEDGEFELIVSIPIE